MASPKATKSRKKNSETEILHAILQELRLLRNDMMLLLPEDDLEGYAHPDRIKRAYESAVREHPPTSLPWR